MTGASGGKPPNGAVGRVLEQDPHPRELSAQSVGADKIALSSRLPPLSDQRLDALLDPGFDRSALAARPLEQPQNLRQPHELCNAREERAGAGRSLHDALASAEQEPRQVEQRAERLWG